MMLLEDANDICEFLEANGRTIPREKWVAEMIAAELSARNEGID